MRKTKKKGFFEKNKRIIAVGLLILLIVGIALLQSSKPVYLYDSDDIIGYAYNLDSAEIVCSYGHQSPYYNGAHAITSERGYECILAVAPFQ